MSTGGCQSQEESQIEDLWIPNTPPKPSVISLNRQENQINQQNWLGFEGYSSGFTPPIQADGNTYIGHGNYSFGEAAFCAENDSGSHWIGRYGTPTSIAAGSSNASFSSLLALANAADNGLYLWSNPIYATEQHWRAANAFSCQNSNQVTPVTPGNAVREGCEESEMHNLCAEERQNRQTNEQNFTVATGIDADELQTGKEVKNPETDLPFSVVSAYCEENHNPDKEGSNDIDLNKTPRQKVRRKKHRPKVITPEKPKRTPKTATAKDTQTIKRKYVRKKAPNKAPNTIFSEPNGEFIDLNIMQPVHQSPAASKKQMTDERVIVQDTPPNKVSSTTPDEAAGDFTDREILEHVKKSCRRALNFYMEGDGDQSNKCNSTSNLETKSNSTVYIGDGVEVMVENTKAGIAFDLTRSVNEMLQAYMSLPERQFSPIIPSGSFYSTYTTSPKETQGKKSKQKTYPGAMEQQDTSSSNLNGINYNALVAFQKLPVVQFPKRWKKKRTEKRQYSTSSTTSPLVSKDAGRLETPLPPTESIGKLSASDFSCWISTDHNANGLPDGYREGRELYYKQQTIDFGLSQKARLTRKRSRDRTRARNLANWHTICLERQQLVDFNVQQSENSHRPCTSSEALLSEMHTTMTAKGAKERVSLVNYESSSLDELQSQGKLILYNQNQMPSMSLGFPKVTWEQMNSVDAIAEELKDMNIESSETTHRDQTALVLYQRAGTIVPFDGSSIKKRHPRPKVNLDEETNRVWKLLLGNINSEGIDGTDEEKVKWWEEEREVFRGRINSLLARMHLVQGDRRFSPWKGSVVDSVVGVFLTQNVSDHLSSSAFMSMAAHFPLKQHGQCKPCCEEGASSVINKPLIHIPDPEDTIRCMGEASNPSICDQSSMTIHNIEFDGEREAVNSNESSRCSTGCSGTSACYESVVNILSTEHTELGNACHIEDERAINDAFSSQNSAISSQNSADSPIAQTADVKESHLETNSEAEIMIDKSKFDNLNDASSFLELLQKVGSIRPYEASTQENNIMPPSFVADSASQLADQKKLTQVLQVSNSAMELGNLEHNIPEEHQVSIQSQSKPMEGYKIIHKPLAPVHNYQMLQHLRSTDLSRETIEILQSIDANSMKEKNPRSLTESDLTQHSGAQSKNLNEINAALRKAKSRRVGKEIRDDVDWDAIRKQAEGNGRKRERTANTMDSLDWEAVRCADVNEIANTIKDRGMNNVLAQRIKDFLNRLVKEHGSIDLEWLRDIPPDKAKEYLLSIRGLGLKSVECVRLLTLHHLAFPVDTNVGRIAVRLGWVPLQPLPESLQLHLLELYPVLESIQKYLWPRLCKLDQRTLYELHYQMITFGKVFCTKSKPNCNSCPLRGECRHFASAFASARLSLPGPEERGIVSADVSRTEKQNPDVLADLWPLPIAHAIEQLEDNQQSEENQVSTATLPSEPKSGSGSCVPIIEEPLSPEPERTQLTEKDMEDTLYEDPDEIPTIKLDIEEFTQNLQNYMQQNMELQDGEMSKALVALSAEAASIPMPKLKNVSRLRTEHQVYELPDYHPLLKELDAREPDDPCSYLLAIWTPGETANSIQQPERSCVSQEYGKLCDDKTCFQCNSIREANSQTVRGTLLIPCRTAMRGSFPLNGTYFQVNEVFADHETSMNPVSVPRDWIWNLPRRTVYFGTSIPTIFKGLTMEGIQHCFWRGHVCVRGFDRKTRAPRPLKARLHFPVSKSNGTKERNAKEN